MEFETISLRAQQARARVLHFSSLYFLCVIVPRGYRHAISTYNKAIIAAKDVPEALAPALLNRAMAEFKLENFGRALQDVEQSLSLCPGNAKAHYRYGKLFFLWQAAELQKP